MAFTSTPVVAPRVNSSAAVCSRQTAFTGRVVYRRRVATTPRSASTPRMVFGKTIKESLEFSKNFTILIKLAEVAGLDLDVSNCTVFAPNDAAFSRVRSTLVDELLANPDAARAVLLRHILPDYVLTTNKIKGCGFWENVPGGALSYEGLGPIIKIGGINLVLQSSNNECDNGVIHTLEGVIAAPAVKNTGVESYYQPTIKFADSTVRAVYPSGMSTTARARAVGAALPSTTGGRKAMGLISQLPFWQYGPPFNAAKQEDYEPISIAQPDVSGVDYQLMPPGSVIVTPDKVSAADLLPVSGMSKYIGQTKRLVEGDALSNYSRLD